MKKCILCNKKILNSKKFFGDGCLKNIYSMLNLNYSSKVKDKYEFLKQQISNLNSISIANDEQKNLLMDRYLTLEYLKKIKYGNFELIQKEIEDDIRKIKLNIVNEDSLLTFKVLSLYDVYNLYNKSLYFEKLLQKIHTSNNSDKITLKQKKAMQKAFKYIIYASKIIIPYADVYNIGMQYAFWLTVAEVGKTFFDFNISAELLKKSLTKNPQKFIVDDGEIVEKIKQDKYFKNAIEQILQKYGNDVDTINIYSNEEKSFDVNFEDSDLYYAIHSSYLDITGNKNNGVWDLDIVLHDIYDYTDFKEKEDYLPNTNGDNGERTNFKRLFSSTIYNLAYISSNYFDVIVPFEIEIKIKLTVYGGEIVE